MFNSRVVLQKLEIRYCKICRRRCTNVAEYMKHILIHVEHSYVKLRKQKIYRCKSCYAGFLNGDDYKLHQIIHVAQNVRKKHIQIDSNRKHTYNNEVVRNFECQDCGRKFVLESTLKAHSQIHVPYTYVCFCGVGYYAESDFKKHKSLVHRDKKIKITEARSKVVWKDDFEEDVFDDEVSEKSENYNNDEEYGKKVVKKSRKQKPEKITPKRKLKCNQPETPNVRIKCKICRKKIWPRNLEQHEKAEHSGLVYNCPNCKRKFYKIQHFEKHMLTYKSLKCSYCDKQFQSKYSRILHERAHTGEKPYSCKFCSKPFSDPSALGRHTRIHTKDFRFFCDLCPKKFTDCSGLKNHRIRHDKRKFKCGKCKKLFFTKYDLSNHLEIHSGVKKYECDNCGKKFASKYYLPPHFKYCTVKKDINTRRKRGDNCKGEK